MFPYRDENETQRTPVVTIAIITACILTWLFFQGAGSARPLAASVCNFGLIPGELTQRLPPGVATPMGGGMACLTDPGPETSNIFTSMFLHGSWMHLLGNMWFLWIFGNNIEDSMTRPRFVCFYLLCGLAAALMQVMANPASPVPMVGASGAISGIMGAYLILFPRVRVYTLVFLFIIFFSVALPAWVMLIYWFFLQIFGGLSQTGHGGTAFWAHIGGFVAGIAGIKLFVRRNHLEAHTAVQWEPSNLRRF